MTKHQIEHFLHGQVECWNNHDKAGFFGHYRSVAPNGLCIQTVGKPEQGGWQVLEGMWAQQNERIRIEVKLTVINGHEAACHHRNELVGQEGGIETIELYSFAEGALRVRYFIPG